MTLLRTGLGVGDVLLEGKRLLHCYKLTPNPSLGKREEWENPRTTPSLLFFEEKGTVDEFIFTP
jgi:hypothetical protein